MFEEGHIEFKATCEGQKTKPQHPDHYMTLDDDSQSSEATSPPRLSPPRDLETMLNDLQQVANHSLLLLRLFHKFTL